MTSNVIIECEEVTDAGVGDIIIDGGTTEETPSMGGGTTIDPSAKVSTPTLSIHGDTLLIYEDQDEATEFDILVDGEVVTSVTNNPTISFYICSYGSEPTSTDIYYANEGMTWKDWINSNYNTIDAVIAYHNGTAVYIESMCTSLNDVTINDVIINGNTYIYGSAGGGSN